MKFATTAILLGIFSQSLACPGQVDKAVKDALEDVKFNPVTSTVCSTKTHPPHLQNF